MVNCRSSQIENQEKCMVEEVIEFLPYDSPATVELLLKVLEALPREVNHNSVFSVHSNNHKNYIE